MVEPNDEVVDDLANKLIQARIAQAEALAGLRMAAIIVTAPDAADRGYGDYSESEFSQMAGVDRMTVRKWLGKR